LADTLSVVEVLDFFDEDVDFFVLELDDAALLVVVVLLEFVLFEFV
jgi:hypothetical protein